MAVKLSLSFVVLLGLAFVTAEAFPGLGRAKAHQKRVKSPGRLIVGGEEAKHGEFPFIAELFYNPLDMHNCGGSIIKSNFILTAAHCVVGDAPEDYTIVLGEHSLANEDGTEVRARVKRYIVHPDYISIGNSDVALVELEEDLVLGEFIQTVALPPRGFSAETGNSTVAGWGDLESGGTSPDVLNKVVVPLVPLAECIELYGGGSYVDETNVCAGLPEGGKDSCQGDSGGPLICDGPEGPVLCGVVSKGFGCAEPGYPGVYAKVEHFLDWIEENTAQK